MLMLIVNSSGICIILYENVVGWSWQVTKWSASQFLCFWLLRRSMMVWTANNIKSKWNRNLKLMLKLAELRRCWRWGDTCLYIISILWSSLVLQLPFLLFKIIHFFLECHTSWWYYTRIVVSEFLPIFPSEKCTLCMKQISGSYICFAIIAS